MENTRNIWCKYCSEHLCKNAFEILNLASESMLTMNERDSTKVFFDVVLDFADKSASNKNISFHTIQGTCTLLHSFKSIKFSCHLVCSSSENNLMANVTLTHTSSCRSFM